MKKSQKIKIDPSKLKGLDLSAISGKKGQFYDTINHLLITGDIRLSRLKMIHGVMSNLKSKDPDFILLGGKKTLDVFSDALGIKKAASKKTTKTVADAESK